MEDRYKTMGGAGAMVGSSSNEFDKVEKLMQAINNIGQINEALDFLEAKINNAGVIAAEPVNKVPTPTISLAMILESGPEIIGTKKEEALKRINDITRLLF